MAERSYRWLFWTLALIGLSADQASKYGVFAWLETVPHHEYVLFRTQQEGQPKQGFQLVAQFQRNPEDGSLIRDQHGRVVPHVNQGALFGFLRDQKSTANALFAIISLLAALAIVYWSFLPTTARDLWLCAALGLILGGTLGNFYDRVNFNGVRDFLHWNYLFDWPVFNIADCCLVVGASLLLIQAFLNPSRAKDSTPVVSEQQQHQEETAVAVGQQ